FQTKCSSLSSKFSITPFCVGNSPFFRPISRSLLDPTPIAKSSALFPPRPARRAHARPSTARGRPGAGSGAIPSPSLFFLSLPFSFSLFFFFFSSLLPSSSATRPDRTTPLCSAPLGLAPLLLLGRAHAARS